MSQTPLVRFTLLATLTVQATLWGCGDDRGTATPPCEDVGCARADVGDASGDTAIAEDTSSRDAACEACDFPGDSTAPACGDHTCQPDETCETCAADCGPCPTTEVCRDAVPPSTAGTEYFVAPDGDDANAGTLDAPFQHFQKGLSVLQPGDTLTVREGTYRLLDEPTFGIGIDDGTESAYVTIQSYSGERAQILGSLSTAESVWEAYDANIWRTSAEFLANDPTAMFLGDHRVTHQSDLEGGRDHDHVANLVTPDHWTKADVDGNQCFADNTSCFVYLYPADGADPNTQVYELSQRGIGRFWSDYMVVRGLEVYYTQPQPIFFEGANNIVVEHNIFGHTSNGNDNAYGMRIWASGGAWVHHNVVFDSVYWGGVSNSKGITFMVADPANPHVVEYNEVYDIPGEAAIGTKGGVANLVARYNLIHDVHTAFEPGDFRCLWSESNTDGCQTTDVEYRPAGGWQIYGNVVLRATIGVRLPSSNEDNDNNRVINNVFYGGQTGIQLGWDGTYGHLFANNAFVANEAGIYLQSGETTTTVEDYLDQYDASHNLYFGNTLADIHLRPNWGGNYASGTPYTVAEFQAKFPEEVGSFGADPAFVDPPTDVHLTPTSAAVGAGDGELLGTESVDVGAFPFGDWPCD